MHEIYMEEALKEAQAAYVEDEVPIGAVVVMGGVIIGRGHNRREAEGDPTLHAEIIAIRQAASHLKHWRLTDCTLYVTIEPCPMCAGAILQARIPVLVYGARDPKAGCVHSLYPLLHDTRFNHTAQVIEGILEIQCAEIMQRFFKEKRLEKYKPRPANP